MKSLKSFFAFIIVLIFTTILSAETIVPGGYVSGTWNSAGSPYLVQGEITIYIDSTLNIEPGVEVNFQGHYKFIINGILEAIGTEADSIFFTSADTSAGWHSLRFIDTQDSSHLYYCNIQYGKATGSNDDAWGGGILAYESSPVIISHCSFRNNWAQLPGGGIFLLNCDGDISNCQFKNNYANGRGGGICMQESTVNISNCIITNNTGYLTGGGINVMVSSNTTISGCEISGNSTEDYGGGGIYISESCVAEITNCTISDNQAPNSYGGGISTNYATVKISECQITDNLGYTVGGGIDGYYSDITVTNCEISGNSTISGAYQGGGGLSLNGCEGYLTNDTITDNQAPNHYGGGVSITLSGMIISNCEIAYNRSLQAGGMQIQGSDVSLTDCDIHDNYAGINCGGGIFVQSNVYNTNISLSNCNITANQTDGEAGGIIFFRLGGQLIGSLQNCVIASNYSESDGGGVYNYFADDISIDKCTISGNSSGALGAEIFITTAQPTFSNTIVEGNSENSSIYFINAANTLISYCDIYNSTGDNFGGIVPGGLGLLTNVNACGDSCDLFMNIFEDPLFENPGSGNYQITWVNYPVMDETMSPCIDAGDPLSPMDPDTTVADIGAFYFDQYPPGVVEDPYNEIPLDYCLYNAFPNPFNPSTTLSYQLPKDSNVELTVYDVMGREIAKLVDESKSAGTYEITFNAKDLVSGVYFVRLETGGFSQVQKVVLMK